MAELASRVKNGLDELRMLILGDQILLGFETRAVFEPGFAKLSAASKAMELGALGIQVLVLAFVLYPAARHRIVHHGNACEGLARSTRWVAATVLALFALALGIDVKVMTDRVAVGAAVWAGAAIFALAVGAWFVAELVARELLGVPQRDPHPEDAMQELPVKDRLTHVLTECRVALPGAQALLGFQLVTVLLDAFERLPLPAKIVHLIGTLLVAVSTILLVAPAAYHRLVERGEENERLVRVASGLFLASLVPLGLGVACELGVVGYEVTRRLAVAIGAGAGSALVFAAMWFALPLLLRARPGLRHLTHRHA